MGKVTGDSRYMEAVMKSRVFTKDAWYWMVVIYVAIVALAFIICVEV